MLDNQTFNLDQVSFAAEGIKDAQQTVCVSSFCKGYLEDLCYEIYLFFS